jgi:hypothetical protein
MLVFRKNVFDPIHVLPKLLKIMDGGDTIPKPKKILRTKVLQILHLQ